MIHIFYSPAFPISASIGCFGADASSRMIFAAGSNVYDNGMISEHNTVQNLILVPA
jgi:hypothetical protein